MHTGGGVNGGNDKTLHGHSGYFDKDGNLIGDGTANRKSVWNILTASFEGAHFATFPEEIPNLCIKAGSKPGDIILDPFHGAGTTGLVARKLQRNYIGFELNEKNIKMGEERMRKELGMYL